MKALRNKSRPHKQTRRRALSVERLETREMMAADSFITSAEVSQLLDRAAAATSSENAIIAIVDRNGRILGVRTESEVQFDSDLNTRVFAIDGAVAKARTAAFFASNEAPLTSRTIRNLSQSTITQREVESNPTVPDPTTQDPFDPSDPISETFGPGFVAPIGVGGHFPQGVKHTPPVDLFGIEHQSRDSLLHPGADGVKGTTDDIELDNRFNIEEFATDKELFAPESYGYQTDLLPHAQARGIATMPGGIPIYKVFPGESLPTLIGGIGVFFPGDDGYATYEQNFKHASQMPKKKPQSNEDRLNSSKAIEAEYIAFAAVGGLRWFNAQLKDKAYKNGEVGTLGGIAPLPGFGLPFGRIDLVGIQLEVFGPNPSAKNRLAGYQQLIQKGRQLGQGNPNNGIDQPINPGGDLAQDGIPASEGWIVEPHTTAFTDLTAEEVEQIIEQGIAEANKTRAAIRLDVENPKRFGSVFVLQPGTETRMVFSVADREGNILGLYRMPDATVFSIDVAVAKSRNTAYYANPDQLQPEDYVDDDLLVNAGVVTAQQVRQAGGKINGVLEPLTYEAFSNRTFRFLAEPRYPSGVDGSLPPVFSSLLTDGVNRKTAENTVNNDPPPASNFFTVFGYDAFHASRNFHKPGGTPGTPEYEMAMGNQNGVVFFPGSTPLYVSGTLQGGFGVSGDGVDQDDVVTFAGQQGFAPANNIKADNNFYRGVRLPFQKFNRNPRGGIK
ncbi:MAG: hypothetical protein SFU86_15290 [Pirellulaceae bacterium]|nr:hypothetical protein [Pirellulaceae bacterium]